MAIEMRETQEMEGNVYLNPGDALLITVKEPTHLQWIERPAGGATKEWGTLVELREEVRRLRWKIENMRRCLR
jgi:hypothetical protein